MISFLWDQIGFEVLHFHMQLHLGNRNSMVIWSPKIINMDSQSLKWIFNLNHGGGRYSHGELILIPLRDQLKIFTLPLVYFTSWNLFLFFYYSLNAVLIQRDYKTEEKNPDIKGLNEVTELVEIRKEGKWWCLSRFYLLALFVFKSIFTLGLLILCWVIYNQELNILKALQSTQTISKHF